MAIQEEVYFQGGDIVVTRTMAKFGGSSFAIANVSVVRLYYERKWGFLAIMMLGVGGLLFLIGYNVPPFDQDKRIFLIAISVVCVACGFLLQRFWPRREYTFSLKANSGDSHSFTVENSDFAAKVKTAIEEAIAIRV